MEKSTAKSGNGLFVVDNGDSDWKVKTYLHEWAGLARSSDFLFQLTKEELEVLRLQFATSSWGGRRYLPYAFTEQGVAMLSSVLNSERAILVNVEIIRAFVRLREMLATHKDLARKLEELEKKYDERFAVVFQAIRELMTPTDPPPKRRIGFVEEGKKTEYSTQRRKAARRK